MEVISNFDQLRTDSGISYIKKFTLPWLNYYTIMCENEVHRVKMELTLVFSLGHYSTVFQIEYDIKARIMESINISYENRDWPNMELVWKCLRSLKTLSSTQQSKTDMSGSNRQWI